MAEASVPNPFCPQRRPRRPIATLLAELGFPDACDSSILSWVISHPEMEVYLAVDPLDRAIGMVSFSASPCASTQGARGASIDELAVAPAWRRKGIGKELLSRAVTRCKVLGCKRIELVAPGSDVPKELFTRSGMTELPASLFRLTELEGT